MAIAGVTNAYGPRGLANKGQVIAISGASQFSAALEYSSYDLVASDDCWITIEASPGVAAVANTSYKLVANVPFRLNALPGDLLAVIGTSGTLALHPVQAIAS